MRSLFYSCQAFKLKQEVLGEVRGFFAPELLNRFDETVVFQRLRREDVAHIAQLLLAQTVRGREREREMFMRRDGCRYQPKLNRTQCKMDWGEHCERMATSPR